MKRNLLTLFLALSSFSVLAQVSNNELIELAKAYRSYHFRSEAPAGFFDDLYSSVSAELQPAVAFIAESSKQNNAIATTRYLTKPDSLTLENLFIVRTVNWNLWEAEPRDNNAVIDSLRKTKMEYHELLACYYDMLFTSVGNKNRPFDMSKVNLDMSLYGLENDTEKGIFFLQSMSTFGMFIWGFMNVVDPPNFKKALTEIRHYPTYNSQPYYQYVYLNFPDFELTVDKSKPKKSFKEHFINKYLNTLLYHSACLSQKKKYKEEQRDVMLGSIMANESYYKYSETPEVFEQIFRKVSQ